jgi:hypothetical protein
MKDAAGDPSQGGQAKLLVHVELSRADEGARPADGNRPAGAVPPLVANAPVANSATPAANPPPPQVNSVVMMSGECFLPFLPLRFCSCLHDNLHLPHIGFVLICSSEEKA